MSTNNRSQPPATPANDPASRNAGEASGKHRGLRQPADDEASADALDQVGLRDRGASMEDHLRDRRGKGVAGEYDDSIDHDAPDISATGLDIDAIAGSAGSDRDIAGQDSTGDRKRARGAPHDADVAAKPADTSRRST